MRELENTNLKLHIDVQQALNRQDSTKLLLIQEKHNSDRLNKELKKINSNVKETYKQSVITHLKLDSGVIKFYM